MSYYLQIIESYLKHKNIDILLEQAGTIEIQGSNPQERLDDIVKQVRTAQSNSQNPLLLSFNGKTFKCWNNKDGKTMSVNTGQITINITNNPQKILALLDGEQKEGEAKEGKPQAGSAEPNPLTNEGIYKELGFDAPKMYRTIGFVSFDFWLKKRGLDYHRILI